MPANLNTVTLPAAAENMAGQATDHLPADHFVFASLGTANASAGTQPLDHVPEQAAPHVPTVIPPTTTLPTEAVDHMTDIAQGHLPDHIDWLL